MNTVQPKYRVVAYWSLRGYNMTTYSEPFYYQGNADNLLDEMMESGQYTGGHIETLVKLSGRGPEWMVEH